MARIEMRNVTIYIQDGLSGSGVMTNNASANDTTFNIGTVVLNTTNTASVPVGARFYVAGETTNLVHTVTSRGPASGNTNNITFTPALGAGTYNSANSNNAVTFLPQRVEVKIGKGNLTWTEAQDFEYLTDRGTLDTVKRNDDQPVKMNLEFVYEYIRTQSGQDLTPVDAIKQTGNAVEWVTSATDQCEPYAVDIRALHCVPCGTDQDEDVVFNDFRWESLDFDMNAATIAVSGQCNVTEPTITRSDNTEC